jgi:hypothetical protein
MSINLNYRREVLFEVHTAVSTKMAVFWVVAPCSVVEVYQRFRYLCCLHLIALLMEAPYYTALQPRRQPSIGEKYAGANTKRNLWKTPTSMQTVEFLCKVSEPLWARYATLTNFKLSCASQTRRLDINDGSRVCAWLRTAQANQPKTHPQRAPPLSHDHFVSTVTSNFIHPSNEIHCHHKAFLV